MRLLIFILPEQRYCDTHQLLCLHCLICWRFDTDRRDRCRLQLNYRCSRCLRCLRSLGRPLCGPVPFPVTRIQCTQYTYNDSRDAYLRKCHVLQTNIEKIAKQKNHPECNTSNKLFTNKPEPEIYWCPAESETTFIYGRFL